MLLFQFSEKKIDFVLKVSGGIAVSNHGTQESWPKNTHDFFLAVGFELPNLI